MGDAKAWQHPWLRILLLIRAMFGEPWDGEAWHRVRLGTLGSVGGRRKRVQIGNPGFHEKNRGTA